MQLEYLWETFNWIVSTSQKTSDEQSCPYPTASEASLAEEINELDQEGWGAGEEVPRGARTISSLDIADEDSPVKIAALDKLRLETENGEQETAAAAAATTAEGAAEGGGIVQTMDKPTETSEVVVEIS